MTIFCSFALIDFMWVFGPQEPGDLGTFALRDLLCHLLSNCHFVICYLSLWTFYLLSVLIYFVVICLNFA